MKKLLYLTIAIALMGLTSCGEGGTGFDDGTPITQTSWKSVEEFNIPTDTTWEHFNQANLISTITFFDSTSGRITLTLPEVIPAVFSLDFEYTFDGADGEIYYGWGNSFDFTRSSSSTIYMTLPAELLENLDEYIAQLEAKDREYLYERINRRVDIMMEMGLLKEAEEYYSSCGKTSAQAIGYKELAPYLDGEKTLEEAVEALKQSTRRYAKRQLTWFRRRENLSSGRR